MRILQVNKFYFPDIGGIETVVQNIAEGLNSRAEVEVLVCQPKRGKGVSEVINDVFVTRSGSMGTYFSMPLSLSFITDFKRKSKKADIVHIHMPFPLADLACLMSGYSGKVVLSWHSDIVKQKKLMHLYKPLMEKLLRRADCVVVATEGHISGSAYLKAYKDKCRVIPYGIDVEKYESVEPQPVLESRLGSKQNKKVLFAGRLVYYKGVEVLINAFEKIYGCELFIAGTGHLENDLKQQVQTLGIADKVHFLGRISDDEMMQAFADCDFFVLPSVANSEAFGIVQMEAMVYGKPVINTNLPTGVPHVSIHGQTGITVPVNDAETLAQAIQKLADDDELRRNMGENAYKRVRKVFGMENMINGLYSLYEELTENKQEAEK